MYKLTNTDSIIRLADGALIPASPDNRDYLAYQKWLGEGNVPTPADPEPLLPKYVAAVQAHLDDAARALGYDDIASAVTYADEPAVPKFQRDGQAFRAWRSLVWAHYYALLDDVQAGDADMPTVEALIAGLPSLNLS